MGQFPKKIAFVDIDLMGYTTQAEITHFYFL